MNEPAAGRVSGGRKAVLSLLGILGISGAILAVGGHAGERVVALFPDALPPDPYLVAGHAFLVYAVWPASVLAGIVVIIFPGICLALLRRRSRGVPAFVTEALALALATQMLVHMVLWSPPRDRTPFFSALVLVGTGVASWLILAATESRRGIELPRGAGSARRLAWLVLLPMIAAVVLAPVLCWQDLNPDGLEAFTAGRSLLSHPLPLLPNGRAAGIGLGMLTEAFPVHWFTVLVGGPEAAARLPFVLVVPFLFAGLVAMAEQGMPRPLTLPEESAMALGLAAVLVTVAYNASYHAYSADIASPVAIDLLAVTLVVAATVAFFADDRLSLVLCALLGVFTRPTLLLWLVLLGAGSLVVAPAERRRLLWLVVTVGCCVLAAALFERVVGALFGVRFEQGSGALLHRLRFLRFTDVRRFAFLIVPAGFVPALALVAWWRLDATARALAVATAGYFAFFYVIAFTAPHHFLPAMLVPLAVLWRSALARAPSRRLVGAAALGGAVALVIGLPHTFAIDRSMRAIGAVTDYRIGNYGGGYAGYREAFDGRTVLDSLFPNWLTGGNPSRERIGHPWVQVHYARTGSPRPAAPNYVVQPVADASPPGMTRVGADSVAAVYVRDLGRWQRDRSSPPRTDFRSRMYDLPRTTLLEAWGGPARAYDVDLRDLLSRLLGRGGAEGAESR